MRARAASPVDGLGKAGAGAGVDGSTIPTSTETPEAEAAKGRFPNLGDLGKAYNTLCEKIGLVGEKIQSLVNKVLGAIATFFSALFCCTKSRSHGETPPPTTPSTPSLESGHEAAKGADGADESKDPAGK